jgi:hypothetical protein
LTDEAFHPTVLTLWRNKLRASDDPDRIFNAMRVVIAQTSVIARWYRRVLDSTVLDDAVARQDTVTMLATQIRRVRKLIPELQREWVRSTISPRAARRATGPIAPMSTGSCRS